MDMNYLVQRRMNAQKQYRRKVTLTIALGVILLALILVGLIKVMADEKKAEESNPGNDSNISGEQLPGDSAGNRESNNGETNDENGNSNSDTGEAVEPAPTTAVEPMGTPTPTPVPKKKVAVDPGHGGNVDFGSSRPAEGLYEKNANLAIALFLKEELVNRGYEVFMIRETDEAVDNYARPGMALENGADIYVSIHLNSLEEDSDGTRGAEAWYSDLREDASDVLAQYVIDELTKVVDARNRGIKMSNELIVLKYNELPACLVECGFMSSETERAKLFDPDYQKKIAEGIANGIEKFLPLE